MCERRPASAVGLLLVVLLHVVGLTVIAGSLYALLRRRFGERRSEKVP